jgi:hypothetical protein
MESKRSFILSLQIFHPFTPEHKTTNHSSGEFVDPMDPSNTIFSLENENKQLKNKIKSRRNFELIDQYIGWSCYFRMRLRQKNGPDRWSKRVHYFLMDIAKVYLDMGKKA